MVLAPGAFRLMGIVNVTPDSFSDGGRFLQPGAAIEHSLRLDGEGAEILDVGGESTRPGAEPVAAEIELERVQPVIEALAAAGTGVQISVDTSKATVASASLYAGASLVNDVSAFRADPQMAGVVADSDADCCLMHMLGERRVLLDPGIGFGKTAEHNLELLRRLDELSSLGRPLVIGTSRKSFLAAVAGVGAREPTARLAGTVASNVLAL